MNKAKDDFFMSIIPQCSTYCQSQLSGGSDVQLLLVISQWKGEVMVKEDSKRIKISSDVKKQVLSLEI